MGDWVQMGMKKQSSLKTAFWHFLFKLFGGLLGTVAVPFLLMNISTALGVTTYGDYSEIRSNELASVLAATPDLSEVEIPMGIEYPVPEHPRIAPGSAAIAC